MNVLLDTCALLALARGELPERVTEVLVKAPEANVCLITPWEVAIKVARGKIRLNQPPIQWFLGLVEQYVLREIPLDAQLVCAAVALPPIHRDPFDRVLVALAHSRALTVLTSDQNIPRYPGITTLW